MDESRHSPEPHLDPDTHSDPLTATPDPDSLDPALPDEVDERLRAMLAAVEPDPDAHPGPMPDAVAARVFAALEQEARLRVDRGPLADASASAGPHDDHARVLELRRPARRQRPYYLAAAVAAAALVVAAGASALHLTKRPNSTAVIGGGFTSSTSAVPSGSASGGSATGVHVQVSTTAYTAASLAARARELLERPGAELGPGAAEAPAIGPIGTEVGLRSCLEGLGVATPSPTAVSADLATFEGRPAAVVVVTRDGASSAWVVERSCSAQQPGVLQPETPVP